MTGEGAVVRLLINGVDIGVTLPADGGIHRTIKRALKAGPET